MSYVSLPDAPMIKCGYDPAISSGAIVLVLAPWWPSKNHADRMKFGLCG
jgi:hypothetical protein